MNTIKDLWQITKKDLLEFTRDRLRLVTFFIMPIFMMIMTGFIFPNQNTLKNMPIGIADENNTVTTQKLIETISNLKISGDANAFKTKNYSNLEAIKDGIKKQEVSGGLYIPADFSQKIASGETANVIIVEDQANPQVSQMVNQILTQVVNSFSQQLGVQNVNKIVLETQSAPGISHSPIPSVQALMSPIQAKLEGIIPGNPNYFEFVAPGIMAMIVMTAVLTGLAA